MTKRMGKNTLIFPNKPAVTGFYSVVGKKEWEGPLGKWFDLTVGESHIGEESWEKAESKLMELSAKGALEKAGLSATIRAEKMTMEDFANLSEILEK